MTNIHLASIDQYLDVASKNIYRMFHRHEPEEKRMHRIHVSSRDSARTPMQWTGGLHAGFSSATPWFFLNHNYHRINVAREEQDERSILHFYRACLRLRKENEALLWGSYREYYPGHPRIYMYERARGEQRVLVICSFSHLPQTCALPPRWRSGQVRPLLGNYPHPRPGALRPYEAQILTLEG